jgi:hypothetical protein
MFLETDIWQTTSGPDPEGRRTRINATDLQTHMQWANQFQATLNPGSVYFMETGFNGNGNMDYVGNLGTAAAASCPAAEDVNDPIGPPQNAEWIKPLGTGVNSWPANAQYVWSLSCLLLDPLAAFFQTPSNLNAFAWISHTFTHEDLENATYYDTSLQISFNYHHAIVTGIANANKWSNKSFIPPAITGMHNGDALRALMDNGIVAGVGDSTRPALLNPENTHWPLITNVPANGYAGYTIIPRWATRIYYNVYVSAGMELTSGEINTRMLMSGAHCPRPRQLLVQGISTPCWHTRNICKRQIFSHSTEVHLRFSSANLQRPSCSIKSICAWRTFCPPPSTESRNSARYIRCGRKPSAKNSLPWSTGPSSH